VSYRGNNGNDAFDTMFFEVISVFFDDLLYRVDQFGSLFLLLFEVIMDIFSGTSDSLSFLIKVNVVSSVLNQIDNVSHGVHFSRTAQ